LQKVKGEMVLKKVKNESSSRRIRPASTPEARENQLISLAIDLAEKQLLEGTASAQVITHYLKLGTTKERLEKEKLEKENELLRVKAEAYKSQQHAEELYAEAVAAMKRYGGQNDDEEDSDLF
jgi:hypothetical protein